MEEQEEQVRKGIIHVLHMSTCPKCDQPWDESFKFCPHCGKENPSFNEEFFLDHEGIPFEECVRAVCDRGHTDLESLKEEDVERTTPYCPNCGKKLYD